MIKFIVIGIAIIIALLLNRLANRLKDISPKGVTYAFASGFDYSKGRCTIRTYVYSENALPKFKVSRPSGWNWLFRINRDFTGNNAFDDSFFVRAHSPEVFEKFKNPNVQGAIEDIFANGATRIYIETKRLAVDFITDYCYYLPVIEYYQYDKKPSFQANLVRMNKLAELLTAAEQPSKNEKQEEF